MSHFVKIIQQSQIKNLHISPADCIQWVEEGFYPEDFNTLKEIVKDISFRNANKYFAFEKKNA